MFAHPSHIIAGRMMAPTCNAAVGHLSSVAGSHHAFPDPMAPLSINYEPASRPSGVSVADWRTMVQSLKGTDVSQSVIMFVQRR